MTTSSESGDATAPGREDDELPVALVGDDAERAELITFVEETIDLPPGADDVEQYIENALNLAFAFSNFARLFGGGVVKLSS